MEIRFSKFDWLATIIFPLTVVVMEALWVYSWLVWIGNWPMFAEPRPALSLMSIIVVLIVALAITRILLRQKWTIWWVRGTIIGFGLVMMLLVLRLEYGADDKFFDFGWFAYFRDLLSNTFIGDPSTSVVALAVLIYLWWRGINLAQKTSYFRDIYKSFLLGLVALIVLIILWQISSGSEGIEAPGTNVGFIVIAYFFFGLVAITLSHLYVMRSSMPREEAALTSVRRWLPMILGVIGGMVVVVFGAASIFSEDFFNSVGRIVGTISSALSTAVVFVLDKLNFIFEAIFNVILWIVNFLRTEPLQPPEQTGNVTDPRNQELLTGDIPPMVEDIIKWVVIALIIGVILFILARAISRFSRRREREGIEEIHESLFSWKGLKDDLKLFFDMMGNKFRRKRPTTLPGFRPGDDAARLNIREIYQNLQWEGSRSGMARRKHETASEYARRLSRMMPDSSGSLEQLSNVYGEVRYGEIVPEENRVDDANIVWRTVRGLLRRLRD